MIFFFNLLNITCTYIRIGRTPLDKHTMYFNARRYGKYIGEKYLVTHFLKL